MGAGASTDSAEQRRFHTYLNTGSPVAEEVRQFVRKLQLAERDAAIIFSVYAMIDKNNSGSISWREFVTHLELPQNTFLKRAFLYLDASEGGASGLDDAMLDAREFMHGLFKIGTMRAVDAAAMTFELYAGVGAMELPRPALKLMLQEMHGLRRGDRAAEERLLPLVAAFVARLPPDARGGPAVPLPAFMQALQGSGGMRSLAPVFALQKTLRLRTLGEDFWAAQAKKLEAVLKIRGVGSLDELLAAEAPLEGDSVASANAWLARRQPQENGGGNGFGGHVDGEDTWGVKGDGPAGELTFGSEDGGGGNVLAVSTPAATSAAGGEVAVAAGNTAAARGLAEPAAAMKAGTAASAGGGQTKWPRSEGNRMEATSGGKGLGFGGSIGSGRGRGSSTGLGGGGSVGSGDGFVNPRRLCVDPLRPLPGEARIMQLLIACRVKTAELRRRYELAPAPPTKQRFEAGGGGEWAFRAIPA